MCLIQTPISFLFAISDWHFPQLLDYLWLTLIGVSALVAHFSMARAFKEEKISDLIAIDYLRLPILVVIGVLFYNEAFSMTLLVGGGLILIGNHLNNRYA
jgi:drug/metabolite transporter (DMT)-like permease